MHYAVTQEFRMRESRYHPEYAALFRPFKARLESDDIVNRPLRIVLSELNDGIRTLSRLRMLQPHRFERSKEERVFAARCHNFNGHTSLKENLFFKIMHIRFFSCCECLPKRFVFPIVHGTVQIGGFAFPVAGCSICLCHIDARSIHKRRRRVVKVQCVVAEQGMNFIGKRTGRERSRGDNNNGVFVTRNGLDLFSPDADVGMRGDLLRNISAEPPAVYGKSAAGRNCGCVRRSDDQ